jgi:hypothetical protein
MNPTDAMNLLLELEEEGQPWNRPYIGGQTVEAYGIGGGDSDETWGMEELQNSQSAFSPEERREKRAEIERLREQTVQNGNDLLPNYPCGEGPDIESNQSTGWTPHATDSVYDEISGGPYGIGSFAVGDSDYPCPDAQYYPGDKKSDFNTNGVRLSSLPPDQRDEPRTIPAYQYYLELQSKPSDWKNGVANPSDQVKQFTRGIIEDGAKRKQLKDKLKNGQVSCAETPCPEGYICGEDDICIPPTFPESQEEEGTRTTTDKPNYDTAYTDPTRDYNIGSIEVEVTAYPGKPIISNQYRRVRSRHGGSVVKTMIFIRDNPGDTNNLSEFPDIPINTVDSGGRYVVITEKNVISFRTYNPPQEEPFLSGNFGEYRWDVESLSWIPR